MKAAILGVCSSAVIVDVTHMVEKFDEREGAFLLASATPYFPIGSIHIAVVDPLVGTKRRPIILETKRGFFIGPDNGVLTLAAEAQVIVQAREITNLKLMLPHISETFHGRDIFAPAAAHLANGVLLEEFGPKIRDIVTPKFTKVTRRRNTVSGEVLHIDDFGNIITNIPSNYIARFRNGTVQVDLPIRKEQMKVLGTYADASLTEHIVLAGSHGYVEIASNQGNAAEKFHAKAGEKVTLSLI